MNTNEFLKMAALLHGFVNSTPVCVVSEATILDAPTGTVRMQVLLADLFTAYCRHMEQLVPAFPPEQAVNAQRQHMSIDDVFGPANPEHVAQQDAAERSGGMP